MPRPKPRAKRSSATPRRSAKLPKLRGIFFGTSEFAVPALRAFFAAVDCALVVTQPDRPAGRGQRLQATPVKLAANALGIPTIEPEKLRDTVPLLGKEHADLFAVASYGKIVPQNVLDLAPRGALNVHPSLLPLYRGATPLQSQLRDGVTEGGVSIILMDAGMDTGDIVLQARSEIGPAETYGELHDRFALLGAELLSEACALATGEKLVRKPQAGLAPAIDIARTATRPLGKEDLLIDWRWHAKRIVDHVRSLSPAPAARARLDGEAEMVKILAARAVSGHVPGELVVPCGGGEYVAIDRLVPPNRKAVSGHEYVAAARLAIGRIR